ncbi:MAG: M48 family metallopeptidase [Deltaproteobacteria bacterium]|nr:M48 family metallopeptidase [Deltaproteobacteria bacterium]
MSTGTGGSTEKSSVQYGRTRIDYDIHRSANRKTVSVAVDPVKGVLLTAPVGVTVERLDGVVKAKAQWIVNRLRELDTYETRPNAKELVSGESFAYLGRNYRLRVVECDVPGPARLEQGWLVVEVDPALPEAERNGTISKTIRAWYVARASERLEQRAAHWASLAGVEVAGVQVKDQHKRWGSCDRKGLLRFNWRIIQAPMRLVDYVVAHEVVHVRYADHGRDFWGLLGVLMPDYERRKDELARMGSRLEW